MSEVEREMWEISENLHRADLTKEERDNHIRRYAELLRARREQTGHDVQFNDPKKKQAGPGRGHKSIAGEIVSTVGLSKKTVDRALKPEKLLFLARQ
jgi:hypothetical protein